METNTFNVATKNNETGKFDEKEYTISEKQLELVGEVESLVREIFNDKTVDPQVPRYNLEGLIEFIEDSLGQNGIAAQQRRQL